MELPSLADHDRCDHPSRQPQIPSHRILDDLTPPLGDRAEGDLAEPWYSEFSRDDRLERGAELVGDGAGNGDSAARQPEDDHVSTTRDIA
jgi:hypothetical protein